MSSGIEFHNTSAPYTIKILGEDERDLVTIYADEPRVEVHHPGMETEAAKIFWNAINTENPVAANDRKWRAKAEAAVVPLREEIADCGDPECGLCESMTLTIHRLLEDSE